MSEIIGYNNAMLSRMRELVADTIFKEYHSFYPFECIFIPKIHAPLMGISPIKQLYEKREMELDDIKYDLQTTFLMIYGFTPFNS